MTFGFKAQRKGCHVQEENVLDFAAKHAALNSSTDCNTFIGVDALEGFLAGDALDRFLNSRDTG